MTNQFPARVPNALQYETDPQRPDCYRVVDAQGRVWAEAVPTEAAVRLFAASPELLLGYDSMLDEMHRLFRSNWDINFSDPEIWEFADDEGALESQFPGAPDFARWLQQLSSCSDKLRASE